MRYLATSLLIRTLSWRNPGDTNPVVVVFEKYEHVSLKDNAF